MTLETVEGRLEANLRANTRRLLRNDAPGLAVWDSDSGTMKRIRLNGISYLDITQELVDAINVQLYEAYDAGFKNGESTEAWRRGTD